MFGARYPIIQAPMGGGITTPEMVAAVSNADGLGSLASGYSSPEAIAADIARVRALTTRPFAVNLFAFDYPALDRDPGPMLALLARYHGELALPAPALPEKPGERFAEQAAAVLAARVPVFSFTFGIPPPEWLAAFRAAGMRSPAPRRPSARRSSSPRPASTRSSSREPRPAPTAARSTSRSRSRWCRR